MAGGPQVEVCGTWVDLVAVGLVDVEVPRLEVVVMDSPLVLETAWDVGWVTWVVWEEEWEGEWEEVGQV